MYALQIFFIVFIMASKEFQLRHLRNIVSLTIENVNVGYLVRKLNKLKSLFKLFSVN